ncbi:MAG: radical SAM protein [Chthonomonadales bacterium]|nr:radical SAM protein [Chthonomonadales bacterium]
MAFDGPAQLRAMIRSCRLCPRACGANRVSGQPGWCRLGAEALVASAGPHFGEEPPLVGSGGSGTIFFASCNLDCVYCQNDDISHTLDGDPADAAQVSALMLRLERMGCENVNFVTPTHVAHVVAGAIALARAQGFALPTVYNCGGYESVETLRLLDGLVDIYMPDFKYADAERGLRYSGVPDYPRVAQAALAEMYRQVGPLRVNRRGVAERGVLVRHLVLPGDIAGSEQVLRTVAETAPGAAVNVMAQYRPCSRARLFPELLDRPDPHEVMRLRRVAESLGLANVDH